MRKRELQTDIQNENEKKVMREGCRERERGGGGGGVKKKNKKRV